MTTEAIATAAAELPRYQCHKKVWALKIKDFFIEGSDGAVSSVIITPEDARYAPFRVDEEYCNKHSPHVGGYYVVYDDGYKSFSPAEAFEAGYTRL